MDLQERSLATRERLVDDRRRTLDGRERLLDAREEAADARDRAADLRDRLAGERLGATAASGDNDQWALEAQLAAAESHRLARDERMAASAVRAQAAEDRTRAAETRFVAARFRGGVPLDDLTHVLRRGAGLELIDRELTRAARLREPLTLAFVDVDQLKMVNDELGHVVGDEVLRLVARVVTEHLRPYDIVVRYGGDEFLVVFVNTDIGHARSRLASVSAMLVEGFEDAGRRVPVRVSFGLAERAEEEMTEHLVKEADADLLTKRMLAR
jgi:diguanylate cyclase (GGDEF)-like protein